MCLDIRNASMHSTVSQPNTSMMRASWTLARIPRLLATYEFGTATPAQGSCKPCAARPRRIAPHFFPHTRPPDTDTDTHAHFSLQHTTFTHTLEVGSACLAYQRLLVNPYCTFDLCRPRGRARPPSASCDQCVFALTRSGDGILPGGHVHGGHPVPQGLHAFQARRRLCLPL